MIFTPAVEVVIVLYNIIIWYYENRTRRSPYSSYAACLFNTTLLGRIFFCSPVTSEIRYDDDVDDGARTDGRCAVHTRTHTSDTLTHTHTRARAKRHTDTAAARRRRKQRTQHVTTTYERSPRLRLY